VRVPEDAPTIQEAVDVAEPGGLVLIGPGVHGEAVRVTTPFLTIRGVDRNATVLDGGFRLANGIHVIEADGVAIENLTVRNYRLNGVLWSSVFGYRASYVTAANNGDYGIFAFASVWGQFDRSYASGSPDSGFYIGQCSPCHAVITDVLAENNALGFSGTNAGGDLLIVNSEWRHNLSGIVPNTLDSELLAPQRDVTIAGNWVHDNNNRSAPSRPLQYPSFGTGILVSGGRDNVIVQNRVEGHETFGIGVIPILDRNLWVTSGNEVRDNLVRGSGIADLALGAPAAGGDCFGGNDFGTSLPPAIEIGFGCGLTPHPAGGGEPGVTLSPGLRFVEALGEESLGGDRRTQPLPPPQEAMPNAVEAPPDPAIAEIAVPEPVRIRDARALDLAPDRTVRPEVTIVGVPLATTWWGLLIGLYGYALPVILYSAWVSIALWDLLRREDEPIGRRAGWMAGIVLVPVAGPVAYYWAGGSRIPAQLRLVLVAGAAAVYLVFVALGVLVGAG
jgi:hypothetical protein